MDPSMRSSDLNQYKQQTAEGCLVMCCLLMGRIKPSLEIEKKILMEGLTLFREAYFLGILLAFSKICKEKIKLMVDNEFYAKKLKHSLKSKEIEIQTQKIDKKFLENVTLPIAVVFDNHALGAYTHLPHYIVILKCTSNFFEIFNPWDGKTKRVKKEILLKGVYSLRTHIKICPLAILLK